MPPESLLKLKLQGGQAIAVKADVTDTDAVRAMVQQTAKNIWPR